VSDRISLTARWVFPVTAPPLPGGVVTIDGERIAAVEPHGARTPDVDLGDAAVIPGLVNAHVHLDLTAMHGLAPPRLPLPDWLGDVIAHRRATTPEETDAAIRVGLGEVVRTGTTLLGDISSGGLSGPILAASGIRAAVYYELIGMTEERARQAWAAFEGWDFDQTAHRHCWGGASPHAPYSASEWLYVQAHLEDWPVATHLAESPEELELLAHRGGPFVEFLKRLGAWAPEEMLPDLAGLARLWEVDEYPVVLAHGNYLPVDFPIPAPVSIVYCPRTHAAFGHAPHPWRDFLARGVRVALGTDGLASNPDLDLLAEARFLRQRFPDVAGATLLRMATLSGAEALGLAYETGSLDAGKSADLVVIPVGGRDAADPHELFLASDEAVTKVMCRGRWLLDEPRR
jgi:cytosine/adenosine deaminase-related metal-dependent hydrolase